MGKLLNEIDSALRTFIESQHVFFVGTAPLAADGHVNLSPKGLDALRVLSPTSVAYLDYVGSGAETIAHVKENGRIVIMFCAFDGAPRIVRLHGRGEVLEPSSAGYAHVRPLFTQTPHSRAIVVVEVSRIAESCGFGVPVYTYDRERPQLTEWAERQGAEKLVDYQRKKNATSIDGLAAVSWLSSS